MALGSLALPTLAKFDPVTTDPGSGSPRPIATPVSTSNPITDGIAGAVTGAISNTVTNLGAGISWGRVAAFILGFIMIGLGLLLFFGEDIAGAIGKAGKLAEL